MAFIGHKEFACSHGGNKVWAIEAFYHYWNRDCEDPCAKMGTIYFVQGIRGGCIKIGFTQRRDLSDRINALQTGSPVPLRLIVSVPAPLATERALHFLFEECRSHGEWFYAKTFGLTELIAHLNGEDVDGGDYGIIEGLSLDG